MPVPKKLSFNYISSANTISQIINIDNLEKFNKRQLLKLENTYGKELFGIYKHRLITDWDRKNHKWTIEYKKKLIKLTKVLNIKLTDSEIDYINSIDRKEFAGRRAFKRIETPFLTWDHRSSHALFHFIDISYFEVQAKVWLQKMFTSQLYLLNDRMVFYSKVDDRIEKEIEYKDITYINETKSIIEFKAGRKKFYLKYKDNTVLLISLKRIFKNYKIDISEHTNPPRVEETVETILFGKK